MGIRRFLSQQQSREPQTRYVDGQTVPTSLGTVAPAVTDDLRTRVRQKFMGMIDCHDDVRRRVLATARRNDYRSFQS
ncbi:MAG TPA: hypothetical protein VJV03_01105 [Pyrinomonadaceae bacterium]|nr:hypothetical protein [Pyrinomonadaceae bacterium]